MADMVFSDFVTDAEWDRWINLGAQELWDLLVQANPEQMRRQGTINTVAGTATVPIGTVTLGAAPHTLAYVDSIETTFDGRVREIPPLESFDNRNEFQDIVGWNSLGDRGDGLGVRYTLEQDKDGDLVARFWPTPQAIHTLVVWGIPKLFTMTVAGETFDGINGWERYVTLSAAVMALTKEESDPSVLLMERAKIEERIKRMANNRDKGHARRTRDSRSHDRRRWTNWGWEY
jgi:hypothetical protein